MNRKTTATTVVSAAEAQNSLLHYSRTHGEDPIARQLEAITLAQTNAVQLHGGPSCNPMQARCIVDHILSLEKVARKVKRCYQMLLLAERETHHLNVGFEFSYEAEKWEPQA